MPAAPTATPPRSTVREQLDEVVAALKELTERLKESTSKSVEFSKSFSEAATRGGEGFKRSGESLTKMGGLMVLLEGPLHRMTDGLVRSQNVLATFSERSTELFTRYRAALEASNVALDASKAALLAGNRVLAERYRLESIAQEAVAARIKQESIFLGKQRDMALAIQDLKGEWKDLLKIAEAVPEIGLVVALMKVGNRYAKDLEQANSSLEFRNKLLNDGVAAQIATGQSEAVIGGIMREMVALSQQYNVHFKDNVITGAMLSSALGVSAGNIAKLAQTSERTHTSFQQIAGVVAEVAQTTSLTADEAARFASEIGTAMRTFSGTEGSSRFPQVAREVLMFAASLKEVGGQAEDVVKLFKDIQSGKNLTAAAMLGVSNLSVDSVEGMKQLEGGLAQLSKQFVGGSLATRMMVGAYADMIGVDASTLRQAGEAALRKAEIEKQYGKVLDYNAYLQKAYNSQMAELGKVWPILVETIESLVYSGLTPLVAILQQVSRWILDLRKGFAGSQEVLKAFQVIGVVLTVVVVASLLRATVAMVDFARSIHRVVVAAAALHATGRPSALSVAGKIGGGAVGLLEAGGGVAAVVVGLRGAAADFQNSLDRSGKMTTATFGVLASRGAEVAGGLSLLALSFKSVWGLVSGLGTILRIGLFTVVPLLWSAFTALLGAIGSVVAFIVGISAPVWGVIAAVVAVIAILYLFRDQIWNFIKSVGTWVTHLFGADSAGSVVGAVGRWIGHIFNLGVSSFTGLWNRVVANFWSIFGAKDLEDIQKDWTGHLAFGLGRIIGILMYWGKEAWNYLTSGHVLADLANVGKWLWDRFVDALAWVWDELKKLGSVVVGWFTAINNFDFKKATEDILKAIDFKAVFTHVWDFFKDAWVLEFQAVKIAANGLVSAFEAVVKWVKDHFEGIKHVGATMATDAWNISMFPQKVLGEILEGIYEHVTGADVNPVHTGPQGTPAPSAAPSPTPAPTPVRLSYQPMPIIPVTAQDPTSAVVELLRQMLQTQQSHLDTAEVTSDAMTRIVNMNADAANGTFSNFNALQPMTPYATVNGARV